MSVSASVSFLCTVAETLPNNTDSASDANRKVTHAAFDETFTLTAASAVPATTFAGFVKALTAGAATIDLTSLTGTNGATVNGTGLRLQVLRVKNLGANDLTFATGASNGYVVGTHTVKTNGIVMFYFADGLADIDGTHKTIDLTGTTTQTSEWSLVMG